MKSSFSKAASGRCGFARGVVPGILLALVTLAPAFGAPNQATGDIAGIGTDLTDSNTVTINSSGSALTLVKRAYLADGTRVPTTSGLPAGSTLDFLIYVSNATAIQIRDVSLQDVLDPAFVYQTGSIRIDNSVANCASAVCTPAEEDNLHAVLYPKTPLTDAVDTDVVSYSAGTATVDAGDESQANLQLNIAGQRVWAMLFTVRVP